jgi:NAD+ kinase
VLGINLGNLGFLTAAERGNALPAVMALLANDYHVEERMMLEARAPWMLPQTRVLALNDIVFSSGTKMASFAVRIASQTLSFRCDGVIIATSTGSTAYNASAFGPIIDPAVDCMIVNIRYPQPLPFPPVVVHPSRSLDVSVSEGASVVVTPDGRADIPVEGHAQVQISASSMRAKLVRLHHNDFYDTLNEKFNLPLRTGTVR